MRPLYPILLILCFLYPARTQAQCTICGATTQTVNLSSKADTAWTQSGPVRSGTCCAGSDCIKFVVLINPGSDLISFNVTNPAPSGSAYYQINCGSTVTIGQPACVAGGQSSICITYCKPGGDSPNYHITASKTVKASADATLRVGCAATMTVGGLTASTVTWTSIFPGTAGLYNSYLSCSTACSSTTLIPTSPTPTQVAYRVSGSPISGCPGTNADTVKVTVVPGLTANITPTNPVVCSGGASTIALTASVTGGQTPYTYTWSNAASTASVGVGVGTYTALIADATSGCAPLTRTIQVFPVTTPTAPSITANSPLCTGQTLSLSASNAGTSYLWSGPNGFTSSVQNPTAVAGATTSGVYSVVASFSGCTGPAGNASVTANVTPATPTISSNSPVCVGQNLIFSANTVAGVSYQWTGPNGFTSALQNPTVASSSSLHAGSYTLVLNNAGCLSAPAVVTATVNSTPAAPVAASNGPLCAGQTLSLSASPGGFVYAWTGPNGFSSSSQNPSITSAGTAATGVYSVTASAGTCVSTAGTVSVTVNPVPAVPTPSGNTTLCSGQNLSLTALPNGLIYAWNGPNSFTSALQNPVISNAPAAAAGTYSLFVTAAGCTSSPGTLAVTVNTTPAAPVASNNGPVCAGSTLSLTANPGGGTFSWTGPNGFGSGSQNPVISNATVSASGSYSVTVTINGCTSPAGVSSATVHPIPTSPTASGTPTLCAGQSITLTASPSGASAYNWSGPNGFSAASQGATITNASTGASGTYSVTRVVNGCTSPAGTVNVTVNPIPATPSSGSSGPACTGQTFTLSALPNGMIYAWSGPGGFSSSLQNPTIVATTTAAAGIYSLTVTSLGCTSPAGTVSVSVNPTPAAPAAGGSATICAGSTLTLTASGVAGTYNWSGPNGFTSSSQNPTIPGASTLATGMYSVTVTASGCTSPAGTFSANVFGVPAAPSASATSPLCTGQTLSLTAAFVNGATYQWSGPNGFTSGARTPSITNVTTAAAGNYSVSISVAGCGGAATVVAVTINTTPAAPVLGSNGPLCAGSTLSLTANPGGGTYAWSGPNGFSSISQNPVISSASLSASGSYSATITLNGCTSPVATHSVTVNPIPSAPTASGTPSLCAGQSITLSASPSGASSYAWSGPNAFASSTQNATITNASTSAGGTYSVTRVVNGCTSPAGTVNVAVNPVPSTPTAGSSGPACTGQTFTLSALPNGMIYAWSGPGGFSSSLQNPAIVATTTAAAGIYSLTVTSLGCVSPAGTVSVSVNPTPAAPAAGGSATLCAGSAISLTATGAAGSYSWTGPGGFSASSQSTTIPGAPESASGIYSVTVTSGGCTSPSGTFAVNVLGVPSAPSATANTPLCTGQTLSLSAQFINGATYLWSGPSGFTSTAQNPSLTNVTSAAAGSYSVSVSVAGCGGAATVVAVTINTTPASPLVNHNSPICAGLNLTFAVSPGGGSYAWNGPDSFTSTSQNPVIGSASVSASGSYSVTITINGCTSAPAVTSVTVHPIPAAPAASANTSLCAGQTLTLAASPSGASSYSWTGPNGFASATQNATITNASVNASGTYSVIRVVNGCTSPAGTIVIGVNPIPAQPTVSSNSPICALQTLSLFAGPGGANYSWTGPNGFSSNQQNPVIVSASLSSAGNYSVTQTVLGCTSAATVVSVSLNAAAPTPTATSNSPVCVNGTLSLSQASIANASYVWSGPNGFSATSQNTLVSNAQASLSGTYSVYAMVAGCPGNTITIAVVVSNQGTVLAGPAATVCANNASVALTGTSSTGSGTWTSSGSGVFSPNSLNGGYLPSGADISAGLVTLTLTSTNNGGCAPASTTKTIYVTPAPTASAGANQTVCANNATVSLNGAVSIAGGGMWTTSGSGTFFPSNTALTASYVPGSADLSAGGATITLITTGNGNCLAVSNSKTVSISPAPVVSAGPNPQFVCKNNPNYQLNGSSTTGSLTWASSGTGSFSPNANILNPVYFSSTADTTSGSVTLTLTSTGNGGCNAVSQTLTLIYTSTLVVSAGSNQTVCSNVPISLNGVSTTSAGIWTSSGNGIFSPTSASLNTSYLASSADVQNGSVSFTLTSANNGGCNPVTSTMSVSLIPGPSVNAGSSQTVCANNASVALSGSFAIASGAVWSSSGTGSFSPGNTTMNTVYHATPADTTAGSVTIALTTTGNGSCSASTSTILVDFSPAPYVNAGGELGVCRNNPVAGLNGYVSTGSGTWSSLGSGTLSNPALLTATYVPSTADTTAGSVFLVLTSGNNGNCNPVSDTLEIIFSAPPTVSAGNNQTVCANNASVALTGTSTTNSGSWLSSGSGSFTPNALNGGYMPSAADIAAGMVTLTLSSTNNGGCNPATAQMTVYITPAPTANAGTNQTVCVSSTSIQLSGSFSVSTGALWSTGGSGSFTPNSSNPNAVYHFGVSDTTGGSVVLYLTTTGNGNCLAVSDSVMIGFTSPASVNAGADILVCPYTSVPPLNAFASTGAGSWSTSGSGIFVPNSSVLSPTYIPGPSDSTGTTKLVFTTADAICGDASDTLLLSFHVKPQAAFTSSLRCQGSVTSFSSAATTPTGNIVSWSWKFGSDTALRANPTYQFGSAGSHTVSLLVSNGYCVDSVSRIITINASPSPAFSHTVLCRDSVKFTRTAPLALKKSDWDFGDGNSSILQHPYHVFPDTGIFIVTLLVETDSSCTGSASDTVRVTRCASDIAPVLLILDPAVPTGFTPNGDGNNDVLFVKGGPFVRLDFRVFNEWGNQVFQSDSQATGWDGTYKSAVQPVGRFIWTLDGELLNGKTIKQAGEVILNR